MLLLTCPNCGERNVAEFRFGGEAVKRPAPEDVNRATWADYLYLRRNTNGMQREWWYHTPCGCWFVAERHTRTQDVSHTAFWSPEG
ncbi:MAG: sarcosine oxidase subunit delta [Chloroflexi bacterium]|nr:sarcosine oxidase subunit delta [Chloroflexota bacterium]